MSRIILVLTLYVCMFQFFGMLEAKTLHAILVIDNIHDIRSITRADLKRWQKELRLLTQETQMILKEKTFSGVDFTKQKIVDYIENLSPDPSDTILFYFSGHGYRTADKKNPWPDITFEFYKPGLDLQYIVTTIRNKKPQFALVMADCCNNYIERGFNNATKNIIIKLRQQAPYLPGYEQLFCKAKGCIAVSSCSAGQFSYGSHLGGLYTQCFFTSLSRELIEKKPSWKNLLQRANGYIHHIQQPICKVFR